ncbi:MAG TPA: ABC transporter substrate-binding protein, partial [Patescibacteria group bacterium]|nr:ABC transporter substrate-binding protein [Patescibacteria group bacterium]
MPAPESPGRRTRLLGLVVLALLAAVAPAWAAPQDGTLVIGVHVTLVNRWLDPAETEGLITPFMVLYPLHDALVKPMQSGINTPGLAESWSLAKDNVTYEFVLRKGVKFHNGEPVTAEDVKFSFERYKGSGARTLKEHVKEIQVVAPNRVRIVLRE